MKIITINLSEPHVKALQVLQDLGLYPSRSEAIRVAIRDFLMKELGFAQNFDEIKVQPVNHPSDRDKREEITRLLKKLNDEKEENP